MGLGALSLNPWFLTKRALYFQIRGKSLTGKQLFSMVGKRLNKVLPNSVKCFQCHSAVTHMTHITIIGSGWFNKNTLVTKLRWK
jgi:hypothetical protein